MKTMKTKDVFITFFFETKTAVSPGQDLKTGHLAIIPKSETCFQAKLPVTAAIQTQWCEMATPAPILPKSKQDSCFYTPYL